MRNGNELNSYKRERGTELRLAFKEGLNLEKKKTFSFQKFRERRTGG